MIVIAYSIPGSTWRFSFSSSSKKLLCSRSLVMFSVAEFEDGEGISEFGNLLPCVTVESKTLIKTLHLISEVSK